MGNKIGTIGARAFGRALAESKLTSLNIGRNEIGDEGAIEIAKALPRSMLTALDLQFNDVSAEVARTIAVALLQKKSRNDNSESSQLDGKDVVAIVRVLPVSKLRMTTLKKDFQHIKASNC